MCTADPIALGVVVACCNLALMLGRVPLWNSTDEHAVLPLGR